MDDLEKVKGYGSKSRQKIRVDGTRSQQQSSKGWKTPTEKPDPPRRRFCLGLTTLTSKKHPVTETATMNNMLPHTPVGVMGSKLS